MSLLSHWTGAEHFSPALPDRLDLDVAREDDLAAAGAVVVGAPVVELGGLDVPLFAIVPP